VCAFAFEEVLAVDRDAVLRCDSLRAGCASSSDAALDDACESSGESSGAPEYTRAHGARVRKVGPRSDRESAPFSLSGLSCRRGRVRAQLSQAAARLVTYSSYVLRNPESDRLGCVGNCSEKRRGLSGGDSTAEAVPASCADLSSAAR
jgi:hypothetical protein